MNNGRANRTCAVCGKGITNRDICNECFRECGNGGKYPDWLKAIVKIQKRFERDHFFKMENTYSEEWWENQ